VAKGDGLPVGLNGFKSELINLEARLVDSRGKSWVEALGESFADCHIVRDDWQLPPRRQHLATGGTQVRKAATVVHGLPDAVLGARGEAERPF